MLIHSARVGLRLLCLAVISFAWSNVFPVPIDGHLIILIMLFVIFSCRLWAYFDSVAVAIQSQFVWYQIESVCDVLRVFFLHLVCLGCCVCCVVLCLCFCPS